jgi:Toprim domain-containing protein
MCLLLHQRRWWAPARGHEAPPTTLSTTLSASTAGCLQAGSGPLWVCEGAFDALALLAAGVPRVVAIFGVQGWRWDWAREVRALVFALDVDAAGQQWRQFARQAALRGKQVAVLPTAAYGGYKDVNEAWAAGVLAIGAVPVATAAGGEGLAVPQHLHEPWAERVAIMVMDGGLPREEAERLASEWLSASGTTP